MILKFCGFKTVKDVAKVKSLNIDMIGFIHFPKSKRHVDIQQLNNLMTVVPRKIEKVVVVVNPTFKEVQNLIINTPLDCIQFHGNESIELIKKVRENYKNIKIIKALPATKTIAKLIKLYENYTDYLIIDTPSEHYGGTGQKFNWELLNNVQTSTPYLIAGGLDMESVHQLEQSNLKHAGYDISSGIESNHDKDLTKMNKIVHLVKGDLNYE
ncbi:phosphoribosylanthranilate isomerase [Staphylococcus pragensis]|uniref:N-(5'-phosphoribosyl)anthranilate isomerase n=1 Tax=Staphylococcus pragensis TaxID=1611836 RepID=A0A4Z1B4R4_9STAP|nr:phosphoribosylanthranilate isomerase [Staphylococcus pragensis]RTX87426.1 phosphoribosylanthranilate isomerase [Staphylococcus carnosus]TGN28723.1 phosphoribosylanthranilate isomerase [Staphylococcus pragensis]GGG85552.1 N-(5'-phosphoribosyl)anthranilate isomerase [Staphylococcus pragensis]